MEKRRARDAGIIVGHLTPGPNGAITDVEGVRVGHSTIVRGEGPLVVGEGPVRTGVTVVCPREGLTSDEPVFAGSHRLNGNGEMTGLEWIREAGVLTTPVAITNTYGVGAVRDTLIASELKARADEDIYWSDGGGRDLRRYPKRHKRRARYRRKRPLGTGRRERRSGRRRLRRRGDGHDLPRVPRRYRHRFAVQPVI